MLTRIEFRVKLLENNEESTRRKNDTDYISKWSVHLPFKNRTFERNNRIISDIAGRGYIRIYLTNPFCASAIRIGYSVVFENVIIINSGENFTPIIYLELSCTQVTPIHFIVVFRTKYTENR